MTSSAVVGSSAMMSLRRAAQRHRDHRPLPLAARQRERIGARRRVRDRAAATRSSSLTASAPRRRLGQAAMQAQRLGDLGADALQRIERAHRLLKHHGDAVAADLAHLGFGQAGEIAAGEAQRARDLRALGQQRHQRQRRHRLAGARFADDAETVARVERKRHARARHGATRRASAGRWRDRRPRAACQRRALSLGSSASRKPSPSRLRPNTLSATATPGNTASRGARYIQFCASASIRPHEACGGCAPRPR